MQGNAHLICHFNAVQRVLDVFRPNRSIWGNEILMNREANQIDAIKKRVTLELKQIGPVIRIHLAVQEINAFDSQLTGLFDHSLD